MSMKIFGDTIGNRTRDLPTCSTVPQPSAPPRTPAEDPLLTVIQCVVRPSTVIDHSSALNPAGGGRYPLPPDLHS